MTPAPPPGDTVMLFLGADVDRGHMYDRTVIHMIAHGRALVTALELDFSLKLRCYDRRT
jgi:hypothetical protein